jgi:hypothetical protein
MDKTMKKRRNNRLLWTFFIALAFAVIPPMVYLNPLQKVFMRNEMQSAMARFFRVRCAGFMRAQSPRSGC